MSKTIAFIPIRKGSKGIPNKNIRLLGGKPLVCWILDTLLSVSAIDEIWVSTDSPHAIEMLTARYGDTVGIFHRNPDNASDASPVIEAVLEFVNLRNLQPEDYLILAQATSPFTEKDDFLKVIERIKYGESDSYLSCIRVKRFVWSEEGTPLSYSLAAKPMRQDYKGILLETGSFYASSVGKIVDSGQLLSGKIDVIETGVGTSIDIDEETDWSAAENYIEYHGIR